MLRATFVPLACLTIVLLAGCVTAGGGPSADALGGRDWRLVEIAGQPAVGAGTGKAAFLRFEPDSGRVVGSTGCNRLSGTFTRNGAELKFGPAITTKMACLDAGVMQQETELLGVLEATRAHEIAGDTLSLTGEGGTLARFAGK